jgi:hypothetical protein
MGRVQVANCKCEEASLWCIVSCHEKLYGIQKDKGLVNGETSDEALGFDVPGQQLVVGIGGFCMRQPLEHIGQPAVGLRATGGSPWHMRGEHRKRAS